MIKGIIKIIILSTVPVLITGCNSSSGSPSSFGPGSLLTLGSGAGGGYLGYEIAKDQKKDSWVYKNKELVGGIAGVATYGVAELIRAKVNDNMADEFQSGYALGASDTAKQQYWIIQDRQRQDERNMSPDVSVRYYEFPGATERNGVNYVPNNVIMRAEE